MADDVKEAIAEVRKALEGDDADAVKTAHDALVDEGAEDRRGHLQGRAGGEADARREGDATVGDRLGDEDVVDAEIV